MDRHERFVLFVGALLPFENTTNSEKSRVLKDAIQMPPDMLNNMTVTEPAVAALEYVRYKMSGAYRPAWMPPREPK
jgi:hypothetical protein